MNLLNRIQSFVGDLFTTSRQPRVLVRRDSTNVLMRVIAGGYHLLDDLIDRMQEQGTPVTAIGTFLDAWADVAGEAYQTAGETIQDYRKRIIAAFAEEPFAGRREEIIELAKVYSPDEAWIGTAQAPNDTQADVAVLVAIGVDTAEVLTALNLVRPVAMRFQVRNITELEQDVSISLGGSEGVSEGLKQAIEERLTDLYQLYREPGVTIPQEKLIGAIVTAGLQDFTIDSPDTLTYGDDVVPVLGDVTY